jgi:asparagine synthase (glutamine-hydrolysing)
MARRARDGGDLFVGSRPFHDDTLRRCLGARGREVMRGRPPERGVEQLRRRFDERSPGAGYLQWMSYASVKGHLVEDYLARLDKMGMAHSVEGRVPLLDPRLVRWAQRVPDDLMVGDYRQKALMRAAAAHVLPDYILDRPKQGFSAPVGRWAQAAMAAEDLRGSALVEEGLVRADAMEWLRSSRRGADEFAVWTLGTLAAWTRANL